MDDAGVASGVGVSAFDAESSTLVATRSIVDCRWLHAPGVATEGLPRVTVSATAFEPRDLQLTSCA
jgi:hypothetical protein